MKALITGANGFVGPYLRKHLENHFSVVSTSEISQDVDYAVDITNKEEVGQLIKETQPDYVFHLAAQSSVQMSWKQPALTKKINVEGTKNLLEACAPYKPFFLLVSSAEVYGKPETVPLTESSSLRPLNPYAESKLEQEELCKSYQDIMPIIISRSFNHAGPGQREQFVISDFAKQIAEIEKGRKKANIQIGNLEAVRDFSDVRDIVRGYYLLATKGRYGETYNLCSGKGQKIVDILQQMLELSSHKIAIQQSPEKFRKQDIQVMIGDNSKVTHDTGWKPEIPFEQTLKDILGYWRSR
ncbi:NAD-dependent epimerase/dehydratase family protein [Candidatus Woesearchaeota archaeon]|nr:NAD-dependent epimerase/dehydratase family protein [Candidatus Woesearchaeota archaeon]